MMDWDTHIMVIYSLCVWFAGLGTGYLVGYYMP